MNSMYIQAMKIMFICISHLVCFLHAAPVVDIDVIRKFKLKVKMIIMAIMHCNSYIRSTTILHCGLYYDPNLVSFTIPLIILC